MANDVELLVGGIGYSGWKSIRVTRSIESLAGSFALSVSDRWGSGDHEELWPIFEEDPCRVAIDGDTVIDGYVDTRDIDVTPESRTLSYGGRDRAAALVDCSAVLSKWTYRNVSVVDFAAKLAEPFGIDVSARPGVTFAKVDKVVIAPGDTVLEAIQRATSDQGVLLVSDGGGGVEFTRAGAGRATPLIEGANIKGIRVAYDGTDRFRRYELATQVAATDEASGDLTRVRATAIDEGVRRLDRVLLIRPGKGYSLAAARRRADWEARIRAARSERVTVTVQGWRQSDGSLWPLGALSLVRSRRAGIDGDLLISQVEHTIDAEGGRTTQISLVRPDAFTPEPVKATVKASGGGWKELTKGGL